MSEAKYAHDDGRTAPVNGSDRPAVEPSPAVSKPLAGDRTCRVCWGRGYYYPKHAFFAACDCDACKGTGVEPDSCAASERLAVPTARPNNPIAEGVARRAASGWRIELLFAWYDAWIGAFWDSRKRKLYILPIPFAGVVVTLPQNKPEAEGGRNTKATND
jgi:hypothetical protein